MAYAALVSLAQTIDKITTNHNQYPTSHHRRKQIGSIHKKVILLQTFLDDFPEKANSLEGRITDVANGAEDMFEYFMLDQIQSPLRWTIFPGKFKFRHQLRKIREDVDSITRMLMGLKNKDTQIENVVRLGDSPGASSSARLASASKNNDVVGLHDDLTVIMTRLCGETSKLLVVPIVGMGGIEFVSRPDLSDLELQQIESAYSLEDRSWASISKERRVCSMGKFSLKEDKEKFKAAARSKKEKALGKGTGSSSGSKKKDSGEPPIKQSKATKRPRTDDELAGVERGKKKASHESVIAKPPSSKGKEVVGAVGSADDTSLEPVRLKEFLEEVSNAFKRSSFEEPILSDSNQAKFRLSFNRVISGLYGQFEAASSLGSIEGPLKQQVADLESRLKEADARFERTRGFLEKVKASNSELQAALTRSEDARQEISAELEEERERFESTEKKFQDQILELQGLVARQCEEIEQLKVGEGLDLEAFIDSDAFADIKDAIEDSTGDQLLGKIKDAHPDLDLSFLFAAEPSSTPVPDVERRADEVEPTADGVEPKAADEGGSA